MDGFTSPYLGTYEQVAGVFRGGRPVYRKTETVNGKFPFLYYWDQDNN